MKRKKILLFFFFIPLFLSSAGNAAGPETQLRVEVFPRNIRQGDVFLVRATGPASLKSVHAEFQGKKFSLSSAERQGSYEALIGVDLNAKPAKVKMKVMAKGDRGKGYSKALTLKVERVDFPVQRLTLPRSMVDLGPKTLERVNRESKKLKALFGGVREERLWKGAFSRPVEGEVTTGFGLRRVINGQRKSPHTGVDLRADEGTPVLACNSGWVALVGDFFFSGKSVILDHGEGLYSMYFHLSEIAVGEGDRIHTENLLGRVGSTGRSTGPHLHWGIIIRGARVDPLSFLRLTKHLQD
jgi:murein DD-endopeptidase MepM/ murein hydrolase activator NlpD